MQQSPLSIKPETKPAPPTKIHDDIQSYRQPMVTSIGILMGFLLNFLASWATVDDGQVAIQSTADWVVALTLIFAIFLMVLVLFQLLNNRFNPEQVGQRYQYTFRIYMASIVLTFIGLILALFL